MVFIVVFLLGAIKNRRLMRAYACAIRDQLAPYCTRVGFRPFGISGFRARCLGKRSEPFEKIEIAVALVDRENLLHYPLSLVTKDYDRITCWSFPRSPMPEHLEIVPKADEQRYRDEFAKKSLAEVAAEDPELASFAFFSSDAGFVRSILSNSDIRKCLAALGRSLKRLSFDREEGYIQLLGILKRDLLRWQLALARHCAFQLARS